MTTSTKEDRAFYVGLAGFSATFMLIALSTISLIGHLPGFTPGFTLAATAAIVERFNSGKEDPAKRLTSKTHNGFLMFCLTGIIFSFALPAFFPREAYQQTPSLVAINANVMIFTIFAPLACRYLAALSRLATKCVK